MLSEQQRRILEEEHRLRVLELLSDSGNTREVYKAQLVDPKGKPLDDRVIKIEREPTGESITTTLNLSQGQPNERELGRIASLRHRNIIRLYDYKIIDGNVVNIEEFFPSETLAERIKRGSLYQYDFERVFSQILSAVAHAEENGIYHRDLKPENVLINEKGDVKIVDFGNSGFLETMVLQTCPIRGAVKVSHPKLLEALVNREHAISNGETEKYSLGVMMYQALTGELPFDYSLTTSDDGSPITSASGETFAVNLSGEFVKNGRIDWEGHNQRVYEITKKLPIEERMKSVIAGCLTYSEKRLVLTKPLTELRDDFERFKSFAMSERKEKRVRRIWTGGIAALLFAGLFALSQATFVTEVTPYYQAKVASSTYDTHAERWMDYQIPQALQERPRTYNQSSRRAIPLDPILASALIEGYQRFGEDRNFDHRKHDLNYHFEGVQYLSGSETAVLRLNFYLDQFDDPLDAVTATVVGPERLYTARLRGKGKGYEEDVKFHLTYENRAIIEFTMARFAQQKKLLSETQ